MHYNPPQQDVWVTLVFCLNTKYLVRVLSDGLNLSLIHVKNLLMGLTVRGGDGFDPGALSIAKKEVGRIYMVKFN